MQGHGVGSSSTGDAGLGAGMAKRKEMGRMLCCSIPVLLHGLGTGHGLSGGAGGSCGAGERPELNSIT